MKRLVRGSLVRKVSALLICALTASCMSACGVNNNTEKTAQTEDSGSESVSYELSVADVSTNRLAYPLSMLAEQRGYYDDYNLKLKHNSLDTTSVFESMSVGKVDTTYVQLIWPLSYAAQGSDIELYAGTLSGGMCVVARPEDAEELKDLKNWRGKKIGVIQLSTSEMVSKYVLGKEYGYKIGDDLTYTLIDEYPNIALAVEKGNVDIGFVSSEYLETALSQGLTYLFPLSDMMTDYVCCRQSANRTSYESNKDAYKAYLKGQIRAYKDYVEDEDGTTADLVKATGEDEQFIKDYVYNPEESANRKYNPDPNYNGTLAVYQTLLEWDYVEKGIELSDFYDLSTYANALKEIIEQYPDEQFYKDMWTYFKENNSESPQIGELENLVQE
jgi:NitT/TauT family transport system substrate-binding protein